MNQGNSQIESEPERSALTTINGGIHYTTGGDNGRGRGKGGSKRNLKCDHCNKNGHERAGCWILYPHLRPNKEKKWTGGDRVN